jgi:hypothetical protein
LLPPSRPLGFKSALWHGWRAVTSSAGQGVSGVPRIIVEREARLRLFDTVASVIIDGVKRAELPVNSGADFLVAPGHHTIAVRVGPTLGHVTDFKCVEHETIKFICRESGYLRVSTHLREVHRQLAHDRF